MYVFEVSCVCIVKFRIDLQMTKLILEEFADIWNGSYQLLNIFLEGWGTKREEEHEIFLYNIVIALICYIRDYTFICTIYWKIMPKQYHEHKMHENSITLSTESHWSKKKVQPG